jgi:hypothetical protein
VTDLPHGWIPPAERTVEAAKAHEAFQAATPSVADIKFSSAEHPERACVWEVADAAIKAGRVPAEYVRNGKLKNLHQLTGSCVGFGGANMALYATVVDAIYRSQPERIVVPFVGYHYGRGRYLSGMRGRGEGSTGSGQAKAFQQDGFLPWDFDGVPRPTFGADVEWTKAVEMEWSDGAAIAQRFLDEGRKHTFPNVVRAESADQAEELSASRYVGTVASNWGGLMECPVVEGVLLNRHSGTWNHQMWVLGYWRHPKLGRIWNIGNNWGYVHGTCPSGAPPGTFWVRDQDFASMLAMREVYFFADPVGFEDRSAAFDWTGEGIFG